MFIRNAFGDCGAMMERLLSVTQQQAFVLPIGVDVAWAIYMIYGAHHNAFITYQ